VASRRVQSVNAKENLFERGFKTWCENTSETLRRKCGKRTYEPLDPWELAKELKVEVWDIRKIQGLSKDALNHLTSAQGDEWSAVTVYIGKRLIVVLNPRHSPARQASNLMHELAHVIRGHAPSSMVHSETGFIMRTFDEKQEAEAEWLSGSLLLPRAALTYCQTRNVPSDAILDSYQVSQQMLRYRQGVTGITRQFSRYRSVS